MISLRKLQYRDLEWFKDTRKDCIQWLYEPKDYSLEEYQEWFEKEKPLFLVINIDGNDIGYIRTSEWENNRVKIGMDIHRDFRGKGYSKISYEYFFESLKTRYVDSVWLDVLKKNERAVHIYKKLGFEIMGEKINPIDGEIILSMEKHLPSNHIPSV